MPPSVVEIVLRIIFTVPSSNFDIDLRHSETVLFRLLSRPWPRDYLRLFCVAYVIGNSLQWRLLLLALCMVGSMHQTLAKQALS